MGIHLAMGRLHADQLRWQAAIREYEAELDLDLHNALALAQRGHAYTEARDADRAIAVLHKLLEIYPKDGQVYRDLGKACEIKGQSGRVIEAYENGLSTILLGAICITDFFSFTTSWEIPAAPSTNSPHSRLRRPRSSKDTAKR